MRYHINTFWFTNISTIFKLKTLYYFFFFLQSSFHILFFKIYFNCKKNFFKKFNLKTKQKMIIHREDSMQYRITTQYYSFFFFKYIFFFFNNSVIMHLKWTRLKQ